MNGSATDGGERSTAETWVDCDQCGHRAAGVFVVEVAHLDAQIAAARERRTWLMERIEAGDPGMPATALAAAATTRPGESSVLGTQKLLLGLGGFLLSLAGLFFTAVAWRALMPMGKVAVLVAVGVGLFVTGYRLRRRLPAAAEAVAAAGLSLVATATYAAPAIGAFGHGWYGIDHLLYVVVTSGGLALLYAATAASTALRAPVTATAVASVVAVMSAGFYTVARSGDLLAFTGVTALAAAVAALVPAALRGSRVHAALSRWSTARMRRHVATVTTRVVALLLVAAVVSLLTWTAQPTRVGAYASTLTGFAVFAGVLRWAHPQRVGRMAASTTAAAFGAAAVALLLAGRPTVAGPSLVCVALAAGLLAWAAHAPMRGGGSGHAAIPTAAGVLTVGGLIVPGAVGAPFSSDGMAGYMATAALGLLVAGCTSRPMNLGTRGGLLWCGGVVAVGAWLVFVTQRVPAVPERLETFTAPAAMLLLVCGLLWAGAARRQGVRLDSVPVLLPGLLVLVVPGAAFGMDVAYDGTAGPALLRSLVFGCGGALLLVLGVRVRVAAFVFAGTVAVSLSTLGHLVAFGQQVPQWVALGASGLLLLAVGMRWEWLRTHGATARSWVGSLR